jgi:hypothetical protein
VQLAIWWCIFRAVVSSRLLGVAGAILLGIPGTASAAAAKPLRLDAYSPDKGLATPAVRTTQRLTSGKLYVAAVQGTISYYGALNYRFPQLPFTRVCGKAGQAPMFPSAGGSGKVGDDAQFVLSYLSAKPCAVAVPQQWRNFQSNTGLAWGHPTVITPQPLTAPTANHLYDYALIGAGQPAAFRLLDSDTGDNYGSFEISVRLAVPADCDGNGYVAFGLPSLSACEAEATGSEALPAPPAVAPLTINQTPISRVLRDSDVPGATNQEFPSGALDATQFAAVETPNAGAARTATRSLSVAGLISASVSGYREKGSPNLNSTAALYRSLAGARAGVQAEVRLARRQGPKGARISLAAIRKPAAGEALTFTPRTAGASGGVELVVRAGRFVETLQATESGPLVSQAVATALLQKVLRHR